MTQNINNHESKKELRLESESGFPKKLAKPAQRALAAAGFEHLEQLTKVTEKELMKLHGMGPNAMEQIRQALVLKGLFFKE